MRKAAESYSRSEGVGAPCLLSLAHNRVPPHVWDGQADAAMPALQWAQASETLGKRCLMSNSFAFGGNNVSMIIGEAP